MGLDGLEWMVNRVRSSMEHQYGGIKNDRHDDDDNDEIGMFWVLLNFVDRHLLLSTDGADEMKR